MKRVVRNKSSGGNEIPSDVWMMVMNHATAIQTARLACLSRATAAAQRSSKWRRGVRISPKLGRVYPPLGGVTAFDVTIRPDQDVTAALDACTVIDGCVLLDGGEFGAITLKLSHRFHVFCSAGTVIKGNVTSVSVSATLSGLRFSGYQKTALRVIAGALLVQNCAFDGNDDLESCAIKIESGTTARIDGCTVRGGSCGISIDRVRRATLCNNVIVGSRLSGIHFNSVARVLLDGNRVEECHYGIFVHARLDVSMTGPPTAMRANDKDVVGSNKAHFVQMMAFITHRVERSAAFAVVPVTIPEPASLIETSATHLSHYIAYHKPDADAFLVKPGVCTTDNYVNQQAFGHSRRLTVFGRGLVTVIVNTHTHGGKYPFRVCGHVTFVGMRIVSANDNVADVADVADDADVADESVIVVAAGGSLTLEGCTFESVNVIVESGASVTIRSSHLPMVSIATGAAPCVIHRSTIGKVLVGGDGTQLTTDGTMERVP